MNSTVQGFSVMDIMTDDSYFNISEMKLSITSLFSVQILSYLGVADIIYSNMIDSFISEILKYESSVIQSMTEKPLAVLFTPFKDTSPNDSRCMKDMKYEVGAQMIT